MTRSSRCLLLAGIAVALHQNAVTLAEESGEPLGVMTFNIRYAGTDDGVNAWENRLDQQVEIFEKYAPDVVGVQEALEDQANDLADRLPGYVLVGEGRKGGDEDEHMAILYRNERLRLRQVDSFWLSETPEVAGSGPKVNPRMVTWARFAIRSRREESRSSNHPIHSGRRADAPEFYVFNTHFFTGRYRRARESSARLILERTRAFSSFGHTNRPLFLIGDFNSRPGGVVHDLLTGGGGDHRFAFRDSFLDTDARFGPIVGFGFRERLLRDPRVEPANRRIDWILYRGDVDVLSYRTVDDHRAGRYPSDHRPVLVEFRIPRR